MKIENKTIKKKKKKNLPAMNIEYTVAGVGTDMAEALTDEWRKLFVPYRWAGLTVQERTGRDPWGRSAWSEPWMRKLETISQSSSTCWRSRPFSRSEGELLFIRTLWIVDCNSLKVLTLWTRWSLGSHGRSSVFVPWLPQCTNNVSPDLDRQPQPCFSLEAH